MQTTLIPADESAEKAAYILGCLSEKKVGTKTVCEILGKDPTTITRWVNEGRIKPLNPGSSKYVFKFGEIIKLLKS